MLQEGPDHGQRGPGFPRREMTLPSRHHLYLDAGEGRHVGSGRIVWPQGRVAVDRGRRPWGQQAEGDSRTGGQHPSGRSRTLRTGQTSHFPQDPHQERGQVQRIGQKFLESLLQKDASEVAITLASNASLQEVLSCTALRPSILQLLCQVLRKACCSRMDRQSIQQLMCSVKESNFLRVCLPQYVIDMLTEATPAVRHLYPEHIDNIVVLVQEMASLFPASSIQNISMLMSALPAAVNALRASGVNFTEEMESRLERVRALIQHLQEKRREGTLKVDTCTTMHPVGAEEGADYRTMPIYPTHEEVHSHEKAFLRPNIISQKYESTAVYLDTQFRLLREDFVRPLREGILLLQSFEDKSLQRKKFDDIRVYSDARVLGPLCSATGIDYKVQFDTKSLKFVRWENSKRLLYGSLVCLSKDNFETFLFATVSHRDCQDLQRGIVHLSFSRHSRPLLAEAQPVDSFLMVETAAYFEAYRHVLEGLQEIPEGDVPFQDYIVKCEPYVKVPAYLERGGRYDLRPLVKAPAADGLDQCPGAAAGNGIDVLDPAQWPAADVLGLDASQMRALQLALTKELVIIQGPPGTGKTYVGLKIVQALLANEAHRGPSPILVVCYTNHALDQFLEGIQEFQKTGIVRVGGRSSSESLRQFTLRELRNTFRPQLQAHLRQASNKVNIQRRESALQLEKFAALLEGSLKGVLHERHLQSHISEAHWSSLVWETGRLQPSASLMVEWLRLDPFTYSNGEPDGEGDTGTREEEQEAEAGLLLVEEEAVLVQAERLLDSDEADHPLKKAPPRTAGAQLADLLLAVKLEEQDEGGQLHGTPGRLGDAGWEMQRGQKKRMKQKMKEELRKLEGMTEAQAEAVQDVWQLDCGARWQLYRHWLHKYQAKVRSQILQHEQSYQLAAEQLAELRLHEDLCILKKAQVIGMTTTGAARYRRVLQEVAPRVVLVEEAAEVLEAHTITTLSQACQHLILIGDHQQLRPSANVYDLAKNFHLEVSLFERLVNVGLPFVRLDFQHRMRPEIARLLTPHIYQELANHPSVLKYDHIQGVSSSLFFVEHSFPEQETQEGKSHQNAHEAQFVAALCKYLLCQNYQPSQITILTTYTGQLLCLRRLLPAKTFQGVKVHVVDKYQGEENDIVLLSLVRSNPEGRVGFLQIPNRVCVALSRAKKGLFCISNMAMLSQVPLWSRISHTLREKGQIGHTLLLCCQNHPETRTAVTCAEDFSRVPEGGCSRPCDYRLSCGHVCPRACHPYDRQHKEVRCMKACPRVLCANGHRCPKLCSEPCGKCLVPVPKTLPRCGHLQEVPCSTSEEAFCCQVPCKEDLLCGHNCRQTCGQECTKHCLEMVLAVLRCGHSQEVKCCTAADVASGRPVPCNAKCLSTLECGHACAGSCHSCFNGRFHEQCSRPCECFLICSHKCLEPCTSNCPPCQLSCQNRCCHSCCQKKCGEPCTPCMEPCEWRCQHYQCTKLCSEPCDRPRCDVPCPKQLPCGHPCAGMCGEPCPPKCLVCHHEELTQIFFGFEDEPGARFVQLEDCGHVFEAKGLDCYMDEAGSTAAVRLKVCPSCQTPIRRNLRYGMLVRRSLQEVEQVKAQVQGSAADAAATRHRLAGVLMGKASVLEQHLAEQYAQLQEKLKDPFLCSQSLEAMENQLSFFMRLASLYSALRQLAPSQREGVRRRLAEVGQWVQVPRLTFTPQQLLDLQSELQRLGLLLELLAACRALGEKLDAPLANQISSIQQVLEGVGRFTLEDEQLVKGRMEEVRAALPKSGLGLSEAERVQIVAAVTGSRQGHWFKCQNGHIYVIGDCGGAMVEGDCPECHEVIGGTNHRLNPSNQLAHEMDGATRAAWPQGPGDLLHPVERPQFP